MHYSCFFYLLSLYLFIYLSPILSPSILSIYLSIALSLFLSSAILTVEYTYRVFKKYCQIQRFRKFLKVWITIWKTATSDKSDSLISLKKENCKRNSSNEHPVPQIYSYKSPMFHNSVFTLRKEESQLWRRSIANINKQLGKI